jgi:hypothetical protein
VSPRVAAPLTERNQKLLRVPDLGENVNQAGFGTDVPRKLLVPDSVSVEEAASGNVSRTAQRRVTADREDGSPVETWELVDVPCRPIVGLEARTETLEPLVHPVDVLGGAFAGDDTLDNGVLLAITSDKSERCSVEVWRCGGLEVWRCGGMKGWRGNDRRSRCQLSIPYGRDTTHALGVEIGEGLGGGLDVLAPQLEVASVGANRGGVFAVDTGLGLNDHGEGLGLERRWKGEETRLDDYVAQRGTNDDVWEERSEKKETTPTRLPTVIYSCGSLRAPRRNRRRGVCFASDARLFYLLRFSVRTKDAQIRPAASVNYSAS